VKLAAKVDDEMCEGLLGIKACREIGDAAGLVALAETDNMAWTGSPMLMCAAAEGLIAMGKLAEAIGVLDRAEQAFPKAVRPKQLRGLALARSADTMQAQQVLGKLYAAGEIGPETLGIFARTWMDRYTETGERMFLLKSRDLYRQAFEAFPTDYYTGINAASKSLLAGEKETAAQIAERVQKVVGDTPVVDDYWRTATVAEALLLQGKVEAAAKTYTAAVLAAPFDSGSHDSTRTQAALLLSALGATDEQKALVMAAFPAGAKTST
jgi:tetratricopeptide (TPR) repeat protein